MLLLPGFSIRKQLRISEHHLILMCSIIRIPNNISIDRKLTEKYCLGSSNELLSASFYEGACKPILVKYIALISGPILKDLIINQATQKKKSKFKLLHISLHCKNWHSNISNYHRPGRIFMDLQWFERILPFSFNIHHF